MKPKRNESRCPNCSKKIARQSTFCRFCGKGTKSSPKVTFRLANFWVLVLILLGILGLVVQRVVGENNFAIPSLFCSAETATNRANKATVLIKTDYGTGSGFYVDSKHIVTNNHVVEGVRNVDVILYDGTNVSGEVIGWDNKADIAVIESKISAPQTLRWRTSVAKPGSDVMTMGYPLSDVEALRGDATVTKGTFSAIRKGLHDVEFVQTDASINPGNSGGPLIDVCGNVVGVNVLSVRVDLRSESVFYAVSSTTASRISKKIISNPTYTEPEGTLPSFSEDEDPEKVVVSYYESINSGDLLEAYSLFTRKRQKQIDVDDWIKLFNDTYLIDIENIVVTSQEPKTVVVDITIYYTDGLNTLAQEAVSTWILKYSGGALALDELVVKNGSKKAVYSDSYMDTVNKLKAETESFYSAISDRNFSSYPQDKVQKFKNLITENIRIINTLYDKVSTDQPLSRNDIDNLDVFKKNDNEIREINREFQRIDIQDYYNLFY